MHSTHAVHKTELLRPPPLPAHRATTRRRTIQFDDNVQSIHNGGMTSEVQVSVTDARGQLADLVNRVAYTGEQVTLTRHGRPVAVLVSVADAERARGAAGEEPTVAEVSSLAPRTLHVPERPEQSLEIAARTTSTRPEAGGAQPPAGRC